MTHKHTKGPWRALPTDPVVNTNICWVVAENGKVVAKTNGIAYNRGEAPTNLQCEANARLIAAAPGMLEALGTALETMEWAKREGGKQYQNAVEDLYPIVKAALKKAKGE